MNKFIEEVFDSRPDYCLVKMNDISNTTQTYEGDAFLVSFNLPREYWDKEFKDLTIGEYQQLERMTVDANIPLSNPEYPPFQLGQTVGSVHLVTAIDGINIWEFIERARSAKKKDYFSLQAIFHEMKKEKEIKQAEEDKSNED